MFSKMYCITNNSLIGFIPTRFTWGCMVLKRIHNLSRSHSTDWAVQAERKIFQPYPTSLRIIVEIVIYTTKVTFTPLSYVFCSSSESESTSHHNYRLYNFHMGIYRHHNRSNSRLVNIPPCPGIDNHFCLSRLRVCCSNLHPKSSKDPLLSCLDIVGFSKTSSPVQLLSGTPATANEKREK